MIRSLSMPGSDAGWRLLVERSHIPESVTFTITVHGLYREDRRLFQSQESAGGVILARDGTPLEYTELTGTWPGYAHDGIRVADVPDSVEAEVEFSADVSASVSLLPLEVI